MRKRMNENMIWTDSQDYQTDEILSHPFTLTPPVQRAACALPFGGSVPSRINRNHSLNQIPHVIFNLSHLPEGCVPRFSSHVFSLPPYPITHYSSLITHIPQYRNQISTLLGLSPLNYPLPTTTQIKLIYQSECTSSIRDKERFLKHSGLSTMAFKASLWLRSIMASSRFFPFASILSFSRFTVSSKV